MRWSLVFLVACGVSHSASGTHKVADVDAAPLLTAPTAPHELMRFHTGADSDAVIALGTGVLMLMGGGTDVDEAFQWAASAVPGADVVVLRASGADGYNDYLYTEIGGFNSVETLLVTSRALAEHPYVTHRLAHAEVIFLAGGDQAKYVDNWTGTALARGVALAFSRGAVIGGTSAGAMVLGDPIFAAQTGGVSSDDALANPFDSAITLSPSMFGLWPNAIIDTHFSARNRAGRLLTFLARSYSDHPNLRGLGVDEKTALILGADQKGRVVGNGKVLFIATTRAPERVEMGQALRYLNVPAQWLGPEDGAIDFSSFAPSTHISCEAGNCQGP